ncbi:MAG: UDP-N-acetylmuramate--L-alanine ligase [Candidatus Sungbacteria bacterium]|nr:UDP-N-acetylmuramate--L-alanine ligase [Candidatus Sungbacteria bacterium]
MCGLWVYSFSHSFYASVSLMKGTARRVYFLGIGGIGVSALAQWYASEGWKVFGSDPRDFENEPVLKRRGIRVTTGKRRSLRDIEGVETVIHTVASPQDNFEARLLKTVKRKQIQTLSYPQALGELTRKYRTITISGAHGKSTTTAMVGLLLIRAGLDPTVVIGTKVSEFGGSNFRKGRSEYLVIEADEYRGAFLNYVPEIAVITNIDREHLDFFKTFGNVRKTFKRFIRNIKEGGVLIANADEKEVMRLAKGVSAKRLFYSIHSKRAHELGRLMKVPGRHNISNAMAADGVGQYLSIPQKKREAALRSFRGVWRRFEDKGKIGPARFFDDYGHHPTEIKATLQGAREKFPKEKIIVLFRPHHAERLTALFAEFARAFSLADEVIVLDTYRVAGRERRSVRSVKTAAEFASLLKRRGSTAVYIPDFETAIKNLRPRLTARDVVVLFTAEAR